MCFSDLSLVSHDAPEAHQVPQKPRYCVRWVPVGSVLAWHPGSNHATHTPLRFSWTPWSCVTGWLAGLLSPGCNDCAPIESRLIQGRLQRNKPWLTGHESWLASHTDCCALNSVFPTTRVLCPETGQLLTRNKYG